MHRCGRRQLLQGSVALVGFAVLSGCERPGQQAAKVPRIGFLATGPRTGREFMIEGFLQGLREHGYVEGQNIVIKYRFSEDRNDRLPALAAELVALKVRLIQASGTPASFAAKHATSTIPIVMGTRCEPRTSGRQHHGDEYHDRGPRREAAGSAQANRARPRARGRLLEPAQSRVWADLGNSRRRPQRWV